MNDRFGVAIWYAEKAIDTSQQALRILSKAMTCLYNREEYTPEPAAIMDIFASDVISSAIPDSCSPSASSDLSNQESLLKTVERALEHLLRELDSTEEQISANIHYAINLICLSEQLDSLEKAVRDFNSLSHKMSELSASLSHETEDDLPEQLKSLSQALEECQKSVQTVLEPLRQTVKDVLCECDNTAPALIDGGGRRRGSGGGAGTGSSRKSGITTAASVSEPPRPESVQVTENEAAPPPTLDQFHISAVTPRSITPGDYGIVDVVLYEDTFRGVIDQILAEQEHGGKETLSGAHAAAKGTPIRVVLSSPDVTIDEPEETQVWQGKYLRFSFDFAVPEEYIKKQVLLRAAVYFAEVPATRLRILIDLAAPAGQQPAIARRDIRSAFMSYATAEREKVIRIMQGIQQVRPDLDLFLDVDSLRSGEDWKARLHAEIDRRDVLYLCWSRAAKNSPYVEMEWQYALARKGIDCVEPIPLEPAENCPPPSELAELHFNNRLLFIISRSTN